MDNVPLPMCHVGLPRLIAGVNISIGVGGGGGGAIPPTSGNPKPMDTILLKVLNIRKGRSITSKIFHGP